MSSFVQRRVERQLTSMTARRCCPRSTQSPCLNGLPSWSETPEMMLPSKSCIAQPMMPTMTVEGRITPPPLAVDATQYHRESYEKNYEREDVAEIILESRRRAGARK